MTKVEIFYRRNGILLSTSGVTNLSSRQPYASQITPGEMAYTWWGRDNLHSNSAIRVIDKFQCLICNKQNNNFAECQITASQYTITKRDIPTMVEFPLGSWQNIELAPRDTTPRSGGRSQVGGRGNGRDTHRGRGGKGSGQQARSATADLDNIEAE
uniref:Uncharacterized protein n=1 Tax=Proboscia inermis TaxID=420281 RepID=A0A7S0CDS8_9STRA|mmetsp:Transcript_39533/g.40074  ORF Transcript_39533/g.40074 Transcript_39533/m.40074 type:complete len:156 (+) Transcript_39533:926-1393(+)